MITTSFRSCTAISACPPPSISKRRAKGAYTRCAHSHAQNYPLSLAEAVFRIESRPVRRNADYFMACSRQAGIDRFGKDVVEDKTRFHVLNNGIDLAAYRFDEERARIAP